MIELTSETILEELDALMLTICLTPAKMIYEPDHASVKCQHIVFGFRTLFWCSVDSVERQIHSMSCRKIEK